MTIPTGDIITTSPSPVAPRRRRRLGLLVAGVGLLVVAVGATVAVTAHRRSTGLDVRTLLVPRPPSATQRPSNGFSNPDGTVPIDLAAKSFGDAVGVDTLRRWGYVQGALSVWQEGNLVVSVALFQFDPAAGVHDAVSSLQRTPYEDPDTTVVRAGDLANGGRFFVSRDAGGEIDVDAYFARHGIAALVGVSPRDRSDVEDRVRALAQQQYERLP